MSSAIRTKLYSPHIRLAAWSPPRRLHGVGIASRAAILGLQGLLTVMRLGADWSACCFPHIMQRSGSDLEWSVRMLRSSDVFGR